MENWLTICHTQDLVPNTGVCAEIAQQQVAIFYCERNAKLYALSNYDPIGKANVMSRGIIGSIEGQPCVASPLYKQHFNLETGVCLEEPEFQLTPYSVREQGGVIQVQVPTELAA
ncbi:nitrite reductase small subunit NirD [Vibrio sp. SCSIO 43135]|jgi:nitrite reductase (NADH) small subunit|uniref:Nitrite reductase small subunit NirD n=1 Tax=Vibrio paucivorans TaxID=2829489 RepID=A0A9X3HSI9_9VIBR|nr:MULTISPECIES: nitrite reductase small subunit NirD [Vibrio]MCW8334287.1 nitrite reductase small subunit NirD [Vibrio paucivorans]USD40407.1 nitrite reductase small subunit NirD [Vibrio sp. SCSIO 43135]